jgi:hypothetical protein
VKNILTNICRLGLLVGLACLASAADQMWTGQVSDTVCGASHAKMIAGHHGRAWLCSKPTLATLCGLPVKRGQHNHGFKHSHAGQEIIRRQQ